jgi:hypothetical protein
MAVPAKFAVVELVPQGADQVESGVRFEWDSGRRSSPRNNWQWGLRQRTKRTDYPTGTLPTEQVLGHAFKPFTVRGIWDDRHNSPGFAVETWQAFEQLAMRGNLVRIDFEEITITGILTDVDTTYFRANYIGYEFTVSPHYRQLNGGRGDVENAPAQREASALDGLDDYLQTADDQLAVAQDTLQGAPFQAMNSDLAAQVGVQVTQVANRVAQVQAILDTGRPTILINPADGPTGVARVSKAFVDLASDSRAVVGLLRGQGADTALGYQTATAVLAYEVWMRDLLSSSRLLALRATLAAAEIATRVTPTAKALYRPHAGESLMGISLEVYGTANRWRDIYLANRLNYLTLTGAELLVIPR